MNRNTRTLIVVLIALGAAGVASYGAYQMIRNMPVRQVEAPTTMIVAAARPIPTGTRLGPDDIKLIAWPARTPVAGSFTKLDAVANRAVLSQVLENEPITESRLASAEAGAGLQMTIPEGMRAISVRVNEVVGVAGFVVPGTKVDVFVTLADATRVVVSNVQVLTAGTRYDQDKSKGEPIPSSVVTLLLTPEDASRVVLASAEGQIMLALRNPLDTVATNNVGTRSGNLFGESVSMARPAAAAPPRPRPVIEKAVDVTPPAPPPPPRPYTVEAIRGAKRSAETIR
jgi:pilus assembly protein CpaB